MNHICNRFGLYGTAFERLIWKKQNLDVDRMKSLRIERQSKISEFNFDQPSYLLGNLLFLEGVEQELPLSGSQ